MNLERDDWNDSFRNDRCPTRERKRVIVTGNGYREVSENGIPEEVEESFLKIKQSKKLKRGRESQKRRCLAATQATAMCH